MLFLLALIGIAEACLMPPQVMICMNRDVDENLNMEGVLQATRGRILEPNCQFTITSFNDSTGVGVPLKFHCFGNFTSDDLSCSSEPTNGPVLYRFKCGVNHLLMVPCRRVYFHCSLSFLE